jgi:hypothetical protein
MAIVEEPQTIEMTEGTTPDYRATLVDINNDPVPGDALDFLTLKYFHEYTEEIINSRNGFSVHNANGVTLNDAGELVWRLRPEETVILDDELHQEPHIATFEFSWAGPSGPEYGKHVVRFLIKNLVRVAV